MVCKGTEYVNSSRLLLVMQEEPNEESDGDMGFSLFD